MESGSDLPTNIMILTITINPVLEIRHYVDNLNLNEVNRSSSNKYSCGGKGVNVSRQLNNLKIDNLCFTLVGGDIGKKFRHQLNLEKMNFSLHSVKNETRVSSVLIDKEMQNVTHIINNNFSISQNESDAIKDKLSKMIPNASIVIFSGSSPCEEADDIFSFGVKLANKHDKISILDTYGNHLQNCINQAPTIIHNNKNEIESSLDIKLSTEQDSVNFLKSLYSKGVKNAYITDGSNDYYSSQFNFIYRTKPPKINSFDLVGSGDAFTAGISYGLIKSFSYSESLKFATAMGAANAQTEKTCEVGVNDVGNLQDNVLISTIGKKKKLIDDSPTI